ncbi:MAG TPA: type I-U CRISPR-associated protein Csb2 [Bacillota bacterium]|nr:type I-U CRISPR-associated protein Csb2 [Bacillota bacterium]
MIMLEAPTPGGSIVAGRFKMDSRTALTVLDTLIVGEMARLSAMAQYGLAYGGLVSPVLSGRGAVERLQGHRHAFYFPADEDGDGFLDHLTVYALAGLGCQEQSALSNLKSLWWADGNSGRHGPGGVGGRIHLSFEGFLSAAELGACPRMFGPARMWRSCTPFVLVRYPKQHRDGRPKLNEAGRQIDGPEDQVLRDWERRRSENGTLPRIIRIKRVAHLQLANGRQIPWTAFLRRRTRGAGNSSDFAFGLELECEQPVSQYPLALGYACHYGLGHFAAQV